VTTSVTNKGTMASWLDRLPWLGPIVRTGRAAHKWRLFVRLARKDEIFVILLAAIIGALAGGGSVVLRKLVVWLQRVTLGVSVEGHPDWTSNLHQWRVLTALCAGGLVYGLAIYFYRRWRPREIFDAIEANALYGGRMSLTDSVAIAAMTVGSVGIGASVGLEAGVTQLGAGMASWIGQKLKVRRATLRTLVGCGAAAAIAANFNAPLAGTFYALELIMGGYAVAALAPVTIAAIMGTFISRTVFGTAPIFEVVGGMRIAGPDYALFAVLGLAAAVVGVIVMRIATIVEAWFSRVTVPSWARVAIGGLVLAMIASAFPQVLSSGHGAIAETVNQKFDLEMLAFLVCAKALASSISIGSGFRGGLFSASLFLGSLLGGTFGLLLALWAPGALADYIAYTLVGMGALAASIVGAPITMILLVFETTLEYPIAIGVAVGVIVATVATRRWFGYSFATWRFHVRGMDLHGGYDVGRLTDLSVRHVTSRDLLRVSASMPLDTLASLFLLGRTKIAYVEKEDGTLLGVVDAADISHMLLEHPQEPVAKVLGNDPPLALTLDDRLTTALEFFERAQRDVVPVVASRDNPRLVGCVREVDVFRRYLEEAEGIRREDVGDVDFFSVLMSRRRRT